MGWCLRAARGGRSDFACSCLKAMPQFVLFSRCRRDPVPAAERGQRWHRHGSGAGASMLYTMLTVLLWSMSAAAATTAASNPASSSGPPTSTSGPDLAPPGSADADAATYARCMSLARREPGSALTLAADWAKRGGAHPADHCSAVALIALGRYQEGATRLQSLARAMTSAPPSLLSGVLDQASQAWLLAGDPNRAFETAREAAALAPGDPEIVIDRAEAAAAAGYLDAAVGDLDRVLKTDPNRVDALVYRASADRALDRLDQARADIDKAVALAPNSAAALLERGNIRLLQGDSDGAQRDWQEVVDIAAASPAGRAARANLEHLTHMSSSEAPTAPDKAHTR
jgi:regulator of sirC expression with transglutaminase-like and TPR domain